jgi:hypothetical protein
MRAKAIDIKNIILRPNGRKTYETPAFKSEFIFFLLPSFLFICQPKRRKGEKKKPFLFLRHTHAPTMYKGTHFMSVEIVIIDAILFRYILIFFLLSLLPTMEIVMEYRTPLMLLFLC